MTKMATDQELLAQRDALNKEIEAARKAELADAITRTKAIIKEYGLTAAQCGFGSSMCFFSFFDFIFSLMVSLNPPNSFG